MLKILNPGMPRRLGVRRAAGLLLLALLACSASLLWRGGSARAQADDEVDKYGSKVRVELNRAELEAVDAIGASYRGYRGHALRLDTRLVLVGRRLAAELRRAPAEQSRIFSTAHAGELLSRYGVYETSQNIRLFFFQTEGDISSQVSLYLKEAQSKFTEMGAGALLPDGSGRPGILVVVLTEKRTDLMPFPRKVVTPSSVSLRGQLVNECKSLTPSLMFTPPSGKVESLKLRVSGNAFSSTIVFDQGPGTYRVEVVAAGGGNSLVAALMEVTAGYGTGGETPAVKVPAAPKYYNTEAEAEQAMLEMINRLREEAGAGPLMIDERLQAMARAHSLDMRDHDFVGHLSPTNGSLEQRAVAAELGGIAIYENVALCDSVEQGLNNLLKSPVHRTPILDPELNYVGIGIVFGGSVRSRHYYITQEFSRM